MSVAKRWNLSNESLDPSGSKSEVSRKAQTKADWTAVRNHTAFRAEKTLGHIAWGRDEVDVYLMRDCCELQQDSNTIPKLKENSDVVKCSWKVCDAYLKSDLFRVRHLLVKHVRWPTKCGVCFTSMKSSISRHTCKLHCSQCSHISIKKAYLTKHTYQEHRNFYCELCERIFPSLSEMKAHILEENVALALSCILCKKTFPHSADGSAMKKHLLKCHLKEEKSQLEEVAVLSQTDPSSMSDPQPVAKISMRSKPLKTETYQFDNFQCPHCRRLFSARAGLKIHVGIAHRGESIIFCSRCPKTFASVPECKEHLKLMHCRKKRAANALMSAAAEDSVQDVVSSKTVEPPKTQRNLVPTNVSMEDDTGDSAAVVDHEDSEMNVDNNNDETTIDNEEIIVDNKETNEDKEDNQLQYHVSVPEDEEFDLSHSDITEQSYDYVNLDDGTSVRRSISRGSDRPDELVGEEVDLKAEPIDVPSDEPLTNESKSDDMNNDMLKNRGGPESNVSEKRRSEDNSQEDVGPPKKKPKRPMPGLFKISANQSVAMAYPPAETSMVLPTPNREELSVNVSEASLNVPNFRSFRVSQAAEDNSDGIFSGSISKKLMAIKQKMRDYKPIAIKPKTDLVALPYSASENPLCPANLPIVAQSSPNTILLPTVPTVSTELTNTTNVQSDANLETVDSTNKQKVFIPVVDKNGKTIFMDFEKAQGQMQQGTIAFLQTNTECSVASTQPSLSTSSSSVVEPLNVSMHNKVVSILREGSQTKIVLKKLTPSSSPDTLSPASAQKSPPTLIKTDSSQLPTEIVSQSSHGESHISHEELVNTDGCPEIVSVTGAIPMPFKSKRDSSCIMRDKVALNLPVVLTKRTNKKMAQDNPFFKIFLDKKEVYGKCRVCSDFSAPFSDAQIMVSHFSGVHNQSIDIQRFNLYYEISFRQSARSKKKYFLCFYCGKEFTTKFNVRRHQMLYCPRKSEIDVKLLGLGPGKMEKYGANEELEGENDPLAC